MNKHLFMVVVIFLGACASNDEEEQERIAAIDDFIAVSDLEEVASIRSYQQFEQEVLNERYVIVYTRSEHYLLAYQQRCHIIYNMPRRPDRRADPYAIYADTDTFRGCHIRALYTITEAQAAELMEIGVAPGERR
jgi:hypothetical protein